MPRVEDRLLDERFLPRFFSLLALSPRAARFLTGLTT